MSEKLTFTILQNGLIANWNSYGTYARHLQYVANNWEDFALYFDYFYCNSDKAECCLFGNQTNVHLEKFQFDNHYAINGLISKQKDDTFVFDGTIYQVTERQYNSNELIEFIVNEIRNPIVGLIASSDLYVNYNKELALDQDEYFHLSRNYAKQMSEFVDQILFLIKLDSESRDDDLHPVLLSPIINQVIKNNKHLIEHYNLTVKTNVTDQSICYGSMELIRLAIKHIFLNSIHYGSQNRDIEINPFESEFQEGIVITDHGYGIQPEFALHIFERFYRIKNKGIKNHSDGYGLGLSLVKSISRKLNGKIKICSKPNLGTKFTLTFPKVKQNILVEI